MEEQSCYHCGDTSSIYIHFDKKDFCCNGCKTVYEILNHHELGKYYELESKPGKAPSELKTKFEYLSNKEVVDSLLEFDNEELQIVNLYIPHIHCSSCIWVLENLHKLNTHIANTQVNFPKKTVRICYKKETTSLQSIVELLSSIGYEPYISLDDSKRKKKKVNNSLLFKLVTSGFAFGNVMFLSFPEYFELDEFWLNQYKPFFHSIMLFFSIPVVVYAAQDYFVSAYKGLKHRILNIDVPIALGIIVLFTRSVYEIYTKTGQGFLDSLCGLIFFLLLGKFFQQKTYSFLSFERDYKSYFPIAITKIVNDLEETIPVHKIKKGDRLLIRNEELIPVDGVLIKGEAKIDYSFVTGEANLINKESGDKLFAGGKQKGGIIEVEATKSINQSYLTQLWSNEVFAIDKENRIESLTNQISKYFTVIILLITLLTAVFWYVVDRSLLINAVSAVLIVACPCALALSAPFTLGNILRLLGKEKIYLKNASVIERLASINTIVFDKTGTLTYSSNSKIQYSGEEFSKEELIAIKSLLRVSNHPLSRLLFNHLNIDKESFYSVSNVKEIPGKGLMADVAGKEIKIGSHLLVNVNKTNDNSTKVFIEIDSKFKGEFTLKSSYRKGMLKLFKRLNKTSMYIISGDNEAEKDYLEVISPKGTRLLFNQTPSNKLEKIKEIQLSDKKVLMVGDGLNDSGALAQSDVGVVIAENVNVFSPACDAIIDASMFKYVDRLLHIGKQSKKIIIASFVLSFLYNIIGLSFAVTGKLSPIIAAILMPLSSISVVVFVTILSTSLISKTIKKPEA
ncbi:heavy metal translocating P-type ATPase [Pseudofulvibacter geojedonensis]|uniref:Heavy metal translocating P-type ATPase n=1 Tax=Pseudofulvibacter geojedonensis TaxID=1123758 RepID=A0ABW3I1Y6_9FLAO